MDFLNKVGNMVGKGIDSIKSQINKAQENAFSSPQQNTSSLPKGVHILGAIENESITINEKEQNINNNKYSNFFGTDQNNNANNINNNYIQPNQSNLNEKPKNSSSMFDYFQKN